jgi:hypothetical protein
MSKRNQDPRVTVGEVRLNPSLSKSGVVALGLVLLLLGNACSVASLAGWYVTRRVDKYLDLSSEQKKWVRARVDHHIEALRRSATTEAVPLLRRVRGVVARGPTEADIAELQREVEALIDRFVARVVPDVAALFASLRDDQIDRFQRKMRKGLGEGYEDLRLPPDERRERADEKAIEAVEKWTGSLAPAQKARLLKAVRAMDDERAATYRVHVSRLNAFADLLRGRPGAVEVGKELRRLWDTRYDAIAPSRSRDAQRADQRRILLLIDGMLTMEQRRHAVDEINSVIVKIKRFAD